MKKDILDIFKKYEKNNIAICDDRSFEEVPKLSKLTKLKSSAEQVKKTGYFVVLGQLRR